MIEIKLYIDLHKNKERLFARSKLLRLTLHVRCSKYFQLQSIKRVLAKRLAIYLRVGCYIV